MMPAPRRPTLLHVETEAGAARLVLAERGRAQRARVLFVLLLGVLALLAIRWCRHG